MSYNYKNDYKKWYAWKNKEEELLKEYNFPKQKIEELRNFDYEQFKTERRYKSKHQLFDDNFFVNRPTYDKKTVFNFHRFTE